MRLGIVPPTYRSSADSHLPQRPPAVAAAHKADTPDTAAEGVVPGETVTVYLHPVCLAVAHLERILMAAVVALAKVLAADPASAEAGTDPAGAEDNSVDFVGSLAMYRCGCRLMGCSSHSVYVLDPGAGQALRAVHLGIVIVGGNGSFVFVGQLVYHILMFPSLVGRSLNVVIVFLVVQACLAVVEGNLADWVQACATVGPGLMMDMVVGTVSDLDQWEDIEESRRSEVGHLA